MTIRVTHVYATVSLKTIRWITIPPKGFKRFWGVTYNEILIILKYYSYGKERLFQTEED